jgi:hypothetical protein
MPRLGLAFLGLTAGGSAFLASGLAGFLTIVSFQDHVLLREAQRAPAAMVHYVPDETIRVATLLQ